MSAPANSDTTLLTELLTYRPATLIDEIINSINLLAFKATDAVEKGLLTAQPDALGFPTLPADAPDREAATLAIQEKAKNEIENGVHQLETLLEARIDKNFDKLEIIAFRSILSVPTELRDWMRLGHYEGLNFDRDPEAPDHKSITLQREKLRETQKLHALLVAKTKDNEATLQTLRALLGTQVVAKKEGVEDGQTTKPVFAFLQNKGDLTGDASQPLSTTASFVKSQLPPLASLLQELEPRLQELEHGNGPAGMIGEEGKTWRRERLEFIEKETRRHLENVRGLELGENGEVRDGEWQGEGRTLGKGEVEDLERVVALVGDEEGDVMDEGT